MPNEEVTKTYHKVAELPGWAQKPVQRLLAAGIITGDGKNEINLTDGPATLGDVALVDKVLARQIAVVDSLRAEFESLRAETAGSEE